MPSQTAEPIDLHSLVEKALLSSKQVQACLAALEPLRLDLLDGSWWADLIQAHTNNVLAHSAVISHLSATLANEPEAAAPLMILTAAAAEMVKSTRLVQEHFLGLQVEAKLGKPRMADIFLGAARKSGYMDSQDKKPSVEDSIEGQGIPQTAQAKAADPATDVPTARQFKSLKRPKTAREAEPEASTSMPPASSPKRHLDAEDFPQRPSPPKRTKLSPKIVQVDKRKSDISMVDVESSPLPRRKRHKSNSVDEEVVPVAPVEEYEDISVEVEARLQQHEARKAHERKKGLGIIDKRKRISADSFTVEVNGQDGEQTVEKREKKRKKYRHSGHVAEPG